MSSVLGRLLLSVTDRSTIRRLFTATRAGRSLSLRFVAGETLDDAIDVARSLNERGARVSLDHLGEHVSDAPSAMAARDAYLACLDRIEAERIDANISVKLTHLGLGFDDGLAVQSLGRLAVRAGETATSVTVDMEESLYTEAAINSYEKVQGEQGTLGVAVQAYLHRTRTDLDRIIPLAGRIRLCKGAYAEPAAIAYQKRSEVNGSFDSLLSLLMTTPGVEPAIATHDEGRIVVAKRLAAGRQGPWEFQMLYGVRQQLQQELLEAGYPLRIYVPYGVAWYPYLTRRLAERPANIWFFVRAAASHPGRTDWHPGE